MPIEHRIDHERRLILAHGHGKLTDDDVFKYLHEVWALADVRGYDELVDLSAIEQVVVPSAARIKELAEISAGMDQSTGGSKSAIVASDEIMNELGHVFKIYRQLDPRSTKEVAVFKTVAEGMQWLGVSVDLS